MKASSERKKNKTVKNQYNYSYLDTSPEEGVVSVFQNAYYFTGEPGKHGL